MGLLTNLPQGLRVSVDDAFASQKLGRGLWQGVYQLALTKENLVALCIGTDRSTGDALGPLTGSFLEELACPRLEVIGTLAQPVHATNLQETIHTLQERPIKPCIIAIDACLGKLESVGKISLAKGALSPGAGVNKDLPPVGDYHMVGIVNVSGFMEHLVLQNTRLNLVYQMAGIIADAISTVCYRLSASYFSAGKSR
ncbi:MAG: spore protease YyaC [Firmicutes bacterium]|nr:spore protease YyaC [Bacillota bacterium]